MRTFEGAPVWAAQSAQRLWQLQSHNIKSMSRGDEALMARRTVTPTKNGG